MSEPTLSANVEINLILSPKYSGEAGGDVAEAAFNAAGIFAKIKRINLTLPDQLVEYALSQASNLGSAPNMVINATLTGANPL